MKFEKRFFFSVIPEWKDQYIALEALIGQIEAVKNAALRLVQSIANIKKLDGNRVVEVDLHSIRPDKLFWEMLDENLQKVEAFYETQLSSFLEQFHALTFQAILLEKIDEYVPFNPGQATKLERELGRLPNNKDMPIGVLGVDEQVHRPLPSSRFFHLTKHSNIDNIKEQLRALKPSLTKLKRSTERKNSPSNLGHSISSATLNADSIGSPSIEDHVRDFQFASAQLEQSQLRNRDLSASDMTLAHHYPGHHLSSDSTALYPTQRRAASAQMSMDHQNSFGDSHGKHGFESQGHSRFSSRSEIEVRFGSEMKERWAQKSQIPPFAVPFQSSDPSLLSRPSHHFKDTMNGGRPNQDINWDQDDFFQSSDSDREMNHGMAHSGNAILQPLKVEGDNDMFSMPRVKLHHSATEMPSTAHSSPPMSARSVKKAASSGYSSFFASEDELSDVEIPLSHDEIRASIQGVNDSDEASQASKDSGYDSGNSFEGLEEDVHNDEQEEPRKKKKVEDNDTETTGSRHQHVPETRLRTRKGSDAIAVLPGSSSATELHQMVSSASSSNLSQQQGGGGAGVLSLIPSTYKPVKSESRGDVSARSDSNAMEVKPLLSVPNTPVVRKKRQTHHVRKDEVEMSEFTSNGWNSDPLPLDAEIPDLLPVSDSEDPGYEGVEEEQQPEAAGGGRRNEDETHVELDLEYGMEAPPRTTFYQMPDPRHLNRDKAIKGLQNGFSELYRGMHLLKRYAELNVEATDKVLAKYEKNIARGFRLPYMREEVSKFHFSKGQELRSLISQTEYIYAQAFTGGHRTPAMQKLRVPEEEEDMEATTLRFGLLFGLSLGFALIILYMCIVVRATVVQKMRPDLIVYRMLFIATLMLWYWGVDMWIWSSHRVNYPFIFEFNTRGHMRHQNIFDIASVFTVVLIGDMMLYMLSALQRYDTDFIVPGFEMLRHVPPESYPLVLVILLLGLLLFYSVRSGFWLVRTLGRIVTAPFYKVVFRDFFLADQLVSISLVLQDIDFTICYFTTCAFRGGGNQCATNHVWMSAILSTMPQLWRLLQCLRRYYDSKDDTQLYNAGKYTTGMLVAIASSMRSIVKSTLWLVVWLIFVIIATVYSYGWDIYKDWSIGDRKSQNWMLRDQLLYPKWWYYAAAIANLALRLMWTITISPDVVAAFFFLGKDGFTTLLVSVEVSRRAMWNIFRLENEQLNNCGKFRAVQDIPLPLPLKPAVEEGLYQDKIE